MADRYWVGGTGNWNDTARWSTTSGGSSGASVPTSADNAYFDGASDTGAAFTVTVNVASVCKDLIIGDGVIVTALDQTMTLAGSSALTVHGSWFNPATQYVRTYTGTITFAATTSGNTITTNGVQISGAGVTPMSFTGSGEWTLGSALTLGTLQQIDYRSGTFDTGNFAVTTARFIASTAGVKVLNLGSSEITTTRQAALNGWELGAAENLTLNAGTSVIRCTNSSGFQTTNLTYHTVALSSQLGSNVGRVLVGSFTAANLYLPAVRGVAASAVIQTLDGTITVTNECVIGGGIEATVDVSTVGGSGQITAVAISAAGSGYTIGDVLSVMGGSGTGAELTVATTGTGGTVTGVTISDAGTGYLNTDTGLKTRMKSSIASPVETRLVVTNPTNASISPLGGFNKPVFNLSGAYTFFHNVDFHNTTILNATVDDTSRNRYLGDGGGNTGITFSAPRTAYWNLAGSQNWDAVAWATTPTGTPAVGNFPLVHDTAVVTELGSAGTITIAHRWSLPNLTFNDGVNPRTSGATLNFTAANPGTRFCQNVTLSSGVVLSGTSQIIYEVEGTKTFTSAGKTFLAPISLDSPYGTMVLQDNMTLGSTLTFTVANGTLNLNNKVLSTGFLSSNNTNTRSIAFGSTGKIQVSAGGGTAAVVAMGDLTNFSSSGSKNVELTYVGSGTYRPIDCGRFGGTESNALSFTILGGVDLVYTSFATNRTQVKDLIFADSFASQFGDALIGAATRTPPIVYGNVRFSSGMSISLSSTQLMTFAASSGIQQFTSNGQSFPCIVECACTGTASLRLEDNLTIADGASFTHSSGVFNVNGKVFSTPLLTSNTNNLRSITFGSGEIILRSTGTVWNAGGSGLTVTPGNGKITLSNNTNTARTFSGNDVQGYPELVFGGATGTATTTITGANRFKKLTNAKGVAYTIVFPNANTSFDEWALDGTEGNLITMTRTGGSGQFVADYKGGRYIVAKYISISNSIFLPTGRGYAVFSTNGGGNNGWVFGAPKFGNFLSFFDPA